MGFERTGLPRGRDRQAVVIRDPAAALPTSSFYFNLLCEWDATLRVFYVRGRKMGVDFRATRQKQNGSNLT